MGWGGQQCVLLYIKASMLISWLVMWGWAAQGSVGIWTTLLCCAGQVRHDASTRLSAKLDWKWPPDPVATLTCGCYCERTQDIQVIAKIQIKSQAYEVMYTQGHGLGGGEIVSIKVHFPWKLSHYYVVGTSSHTSGPGCISNLWL